jgi:hypothetical protein
MQRCAHQLHRGRRNKLRHTCTAHVLLHLVTHVGVELWCEQGWEVERREDCETVADGEEGECREGDGAFRARGGAEELGELVVFVEAEGEVGGGCGEEFGRAGGGTGGCGGSDGAGGGVDCVGGEVGAKVERLQGGGLVMCGMKGEGRTGRTKMSKNGFEAMKWCGRSINSFALCFKLSLSVFRPLAFSMMPLSIMVMRGAMSTAAVPADSASIPTRNPNFDVFHSRFSGVDGFFIAILELESAPECELPGIGSGRLGFGIAGTLQAGKAGAGASATL